MRSSKIIHFEGDISHCAGYMSKLKIEEYQQAKNILASAESRAEKICEQSQVDYETELDRGYIDGKERSHREMSETMMLHSKRTIDHLIEIESELVNVVKKSLRQIIGEFDDSELIKRIVSQQIGDIKAGHSMTLKVHVDILCSVIEKFSFFSEKNNYFHIISDVTLMDTDAFILETPSGDINSSVSNQLEMLIDFFKRKF